MNVVHVSALAAVGEEGRQHIEGPGQLCRALERPRHGTLQPCRLVVGPDSILIIATVRSSRVVFVVDGNGDGI
jgi:hypothetical protein